jgi:uncharacterized membrane protein YdbT with pleckstrin-like domain
VFEIPDSNVSKEEINIVLKKPWRCYVIKIIPFFIVALLIFVLIAINSKSASELMSCVLGYLILFIIIFFVIATKCILDRISTEYRIDNHRITKRSGILSIKRTEVWIDDIRGISFSQSIFSRLLGIGNIEIGTAATAGIEMKLESVLHPQDIVDTLNRIRKK